MTLVVIEAAELRLLIKSAVTEAMSMAQLQDKLWLSAQEVFEKYGFKLSYLRKLEAQEKILVKRLNKRRALYNAESIDNLLIS